MQLILYSWILYVLVNFGYAYSFKLFPQFQYLNLCNHKSNNKHVLTCSLSNPTLTGNNVEDLSQSFNDKLLPLYDTKEKMEKFLEECKTLFQHESSLLKLSRPMVNNGNIIVVGDVHGQFFDVLNIFATHGLPSSDNIYVFNGDLVDRGKYSYEIVVLLFTMKLANPDYIYIIRGNHETMKINKRYNFASSVRKYHDNDIYLKINEVFNYLPLAAVIENQVFIVHGGIGDSDLSLERIEKIERGFEPTYDRSSNDELNDDVLVERMLWSDPDNEIEGFDNSPRGAGLLWGIDVSDAFLSKNQLKFMIRSHQVVDSGFEYFHDKRGATLFSAPEYCGLDNTGSIVKFTRNENQDIMDSMKVHRFNAYNIINE